MAGQQERALQVLIEQLAHGNISRREFLRRTSALGSVAVVGSTLATVLAACGGSPEVQESVPTPTSKPGGQATQPAGGSTPVGNVATGPDVAERRIRKLVLLVQPQANVPEEYESIGLAAEQLKQLGIDIEVKVAPWEQMSDLVWFNRQKWDMTAWQMVGRPERLDPDEFVYNLFHSSTAEKGYNFVGYTNTEYDELAETQRVEMDREKRRDLLYQAQQIVAQDQPYIFFVYPHANYAYSKDVWDESSIVEAKGIGIKNFWTFVRATPTGDQKDMILNTLSVVQAINPLYISGGTDSWITELVWDRLMRINPDGFPEPYAGEAVEWTDDRTVVCTLRPGMRWHDGQPVTVEDVIFSFRAPMGEMAPMYKPFVDPIEDVTAIGDNQVQFTLTAPNAAFETSSLAKLNLIPKHIWEPILQQLETEGRNAQDYQEDTPIGSGPFKFVNWARSQEVILEANSEHFDPPKMSRWILRDVPNVSAAVGGLQGGELNFLSDYTGDPELLKQTIDQSDSLAMVSTIVVGFRFLAPNHRRAPMDDAAFRRAMATAIGKDQILANIYKSFATIADSHVSKALEYWHAPELPDYEQSKIDEARQILVDAGYEWDSDGFLLYPKGEKETLQPES